MTKKIIPILILGLTSMAFCLSFAEASWLIDSNKFHVSTHGQTSCQDCHENIAGQTLHPNPAHVNKKLTVFFAPDKCLSCHDDVMDNIKEGFHGDRKVKDPNKFRDVSLSGDFFCFPEEAITWLESRLEGRPIQDARPLLTAFYSEMDIETPGIEIDDWMMVLKVASLS